MTVSSDQGSASEAHHIIEWEDAGDLLGTLGNRRPALNRQRFRTYCLFALLWIIAVAAVLTFAANVVTHTAYSRLVGPYDLSGPVLPSPPLSDAGKTIRRDVKDPVELAYAALVETTNNKGANTGFSDMDILRFGLVVQNYNWALDALNRVISNPDFTTAQLGEADDETPHADRSALAKLTEKTVLPAAVILIVKEDWVGASDLVNIAAIAVKALDTSPDESPYLGFAVVNAVLFLDILFEDTEFAFRDPKDFGRLARGFLGYGIPEFDELVDLADQSSSPRIKKLGEYLRGIQLLREERFVEAKATLRVVEETTKSSKLKDLCRLGQARSIYWASRSSVTRTPKSISAAKSELHDLQKRISTSSFQNDVEYYLNNLLGNNS